MKDEKVKQKPHVHTTAKIHPDTWVKVEKALKKKKYPSKNNLINVALAKELSDDNK
jgi:hypothetical protein